MQDWRKEQWRKMSVRMHYEAEFILEEIEHLMRIADWADALVNGDEKDALMVLKRLLAGKPHDDILPALCRLRDGREAGEKMAIHLKNFRRPY